MAETAATAAVAALEIRGLSKVFEGQKALADVDFTVAQGEIHALLGQNGSGKSTLIKVLAGYHRPEPGAEARLYGEELELDGVPPSPAEPIRFIHQDLGLMPDLDVVDNLALVSGYEGRLWLGNGQEAAAARAFLERYRLDVDVRAPVSGLSTATQAMLAILRAIKDVPGTRFLLVVDEATASLPGEEVKIVFDLLRELRDRGGSVIYVTHKLNEVLEIADRVTVLRDGRRVETTAVAGLGHDDLVQLIIGRSVDSFYATGSARREDVVLEVDEIAGGTCHGVSLRVHRGELVGVTGLVGSGYESLLPLIFGAQERDAGEVRLSGKTVPAADPAGAIEAGLAFAPGDRKQLSAIPEWSLAQNITLPKLGARGRFLPWLGDRAELRDAQRWIDQLAVEPRDPRAPLTSLSGGNQQRVVIARWIRCGFKALLLEDPTAGVDVGAKPAIYEALAKTVEDGAAVLMTTSDAEEAAAVCDRVVVLVDGRVGAVLEGEQKQPDVISARAMQARADDLIGVNE
jgi:ribose transport system ATP-binding protein